MKDVSLVDVLSHIQVLDAFVGLSIGIAIKDFLFDVSKNIIMPKIGKLLNKPKIIKEYPNNSIKIFGSLVTLILVLAVGLVIVKFLIGPLVHDDIVDKRARRKELMASLNKISQNQVRNLEALRNMK